MHIHWKSLFAFGFIFWLLLCLNEILGGGKPYKYFPLKNFDEIYDRKFVENLIVRKEKSSADLKQRGIKLGLSLLVWNTVAFVFSIAFCSVARSVSWILWKLRTCYRNGQKISSILEASGSLTERSGVSVSRIPVIIKSNSAMARSSDTNIKLKSSINSDPAYPTAAPLKRSSSSISQSAVTKNCQTLFRNTNMFSTKTGKPMDRQLEMQCGRLREEMIRMQANSLKEHALLSRKLETVMKEKRDLTKQLAVAQKENRAARQQLDELLREKSVLIRRLDTATKEFKCNTKTKKFALARLEEATATVDDLKQQLEQVTRDKEILEGKLRVLESEYEKLQERVILQQGRDGFAGFHENTPERDVDENELEAVQTQGDTQFSNVECNTKTPSNISTVSQTELDMKKIELKIKQLEKNLENFNASKSELNFRTADKEESEAEANLSVRGNYADSQMRSDEDTDVSENPFLCSPRFRCWGGRAGDLVGRKDQFAKIQAMTTRMHEKGRLLENIKESCESTQGTDVEDFSSPESIDDVREPKRIVSSSAAFQNFLRAFHSSETMRRHYNTSQIELYF